MRRCYVAAHVVSLLLFAFIFCPTSSARNIPDVPGSRNGTLPPSPNCPPNPPGNGPCASLQTDGVVTLTGSDANGNPITVTITLSDWGCLQTTCSSQGTVSNGTDNISSVVLDVVLNGTDTSDYTLNLQRLIMTGVQTSLQQYPSYVTCNQSGAAIPCVWAPMADGFNLQQPTPIAGSDGANTQWDFALTPSSDEFVNIQVCTSSDSNSCPTTSQGLAEAILVIGGSFATDNLSLSTNNYLAIISDSEGNVFNLGGLTPPTPAPAAANNTQATATPITSASFTDFVDTSQLAPSEDSTGTMQFPQGFVVPPFPLCNPSNSFTGAQDTRVFRTAWYSYTAPSSGSVTVNTAKSHYDTLVYVLTGNSPVACNDDPTGVVLQAATTFSVTGGSTYEIIVIQTPPEQAADPNNPGSTIGYPLSTDGTLYFSFSFTPLAPTVSLSANSLQFSGQLINTPSASQPITLTNNGPNALAITTITASSPFSQTNNCPSSLSVNSNCTINIVITPTSSGTVTGTLTISDNASAGSQTVALSGSGADFQISATTLTSPSITPGQTSTSTISINPIDGFASTVALTCSVAPAVQVAPTCNLSPASIVSGATSTLTISSSQSAALPSLVPSGPRFWYAFLSLLVGLGVFSIGHQSSQRKVRWTVRIMCLAVVGIVLLVPGCGGGTSNNNSGNTGGTTAGSYTVTVTGSVGQVSRTATLSFTIQ
jgi:hypothetical protein